METILKKRIVWFILILTLFTRLGFFVVSAPYKDVNVKERVLYSDPGIYHGIALNIIAHHSFSTSVEEPLTPNSARTPLYPLFEATIYSMFGVHPYIVMLFQIAFSVFVCLLIIKIGAMLFNVTTGLIAGLFYGIDPVSILYPNTLYTDSFFTFLFILCVYFLLRFFQSNQNKWLVYSAFALGLSVLCRPVAQYFFIVVFILVFFKFWSQKKKALLCSLTYIAVFIVCISPWVIRNYMVFNTPMISSHQEEGLIFWSCAHLEADLSKIGFVEAQKKLRRELADVTQDSSLTLSQKMKIYQRTAIAKILKHPFTYAKVNLAGIASMYLGPSSEQICHRLGFPINKNVSLTKILLAREGPLSTIKAVWNIKGGVGFLVILYGVAFLGVVYFGMVIGIVRAVISGKYLGLSTLLLIIAYYSAITGPLGFSRYRLPVMPYIFILSSVGIYWVGQRFGKSVTM